MITKHKALSIIFTYFTGRVLHISESQDVSLDLDFNCEGDRIFIQNIQGTLQFPIQIY